MRTPALAVLSVISLAAHALSPDSPVITEARIEGPLVRIVGVNLGPAPRVVLGTRPLEVVATRAGGLDALAPLGLSPGAYRLSVTVGGGSQAATAAAPGGNEDSFWLTVGSAGARGVEGPRGSPGPRGPRGVAGPRGSDGITGVVGATGSPGPSGNDGATGTNGREGPIGPAGRVGAAGPAGRDGPRGAAGEPGPPGPDGAAGADGQAGPRGPQGPSGPPAPTATLASLAALGGVPCTVAQCPGTTAMVFDPLTATPQLSCIRVPGPRTLRIQGTADVGAFIAGRARLEYAADVAGAAGPVTVLSSQASPIPFDIPIANLCEGQAVKVSVTMTAGQTPIPFLLLAGGSCGNGQGFGEQVSLSPPYISRWTCDFTMDGDKVLTIRQ